MMRGLQPYAHSLLRLIAGLLFLEHGTAKLLGFPYNPAYLHLSLASLPGIAGFIELIGGFLLAIGLGTRYVAFVLSGEMAFAYFIAHAPRSFFPLLNGGELAIVYCFLFLYLVTAGGGPVSLDAAIPRVRVRAREFAH